MHRLSLLAFWVGAAAILGTAFFFYPKWKQSGTEATLSWDVAGYYLYLPAVFIYGDVKQYAFGEALLEKYRFAHELPAYPHAGGSRVIKYSIGQALQFLPWFAAGHLAAHLLGFPADGFSPPYQWAVGLGSLLVALLGLWMLRKVLLRYFSDAATALTLLLLVLGTNYLDYAAINGAMTHNWLFTVYALLLYATIRFYEKPSWAAAAAIGILVSWAALTRPTDIISVLIPLLWGIRSRADLAERFALWRRHLPKLALAGVLTALAGLVQLAFWKYATGSWVVYSYQEQGFSWLRPNLADGLFSYRSGWLTYSPLLLFALTGFVPLFRRYRGLFWTALIMGLLYVYLTFAWDIWWYGSSLGQRAMVQSYPVFALPLAAMVQWILNRRRAVQAAFWVLAGVFVWYNLWLTRHAHSGGLLRPGEMTRGYFWKVVGRNEVPEEVFKLLDNKDEFHAGTPQDLKLLYSTGFEEDTMRCGETPIAGRASLCVDALHQYSPVYDLPLPGDRARWLRVWATVRCVRREWDSWRMTRMIVRYLQDGQLVKDNLIRPHRMLEDGETQAVFLDSKIPTKPYNKIEVQFWNAESRETFLADDLKVEAFR
jgi:hypothetical protein